MCFFKKKKKIDPIQSRYHIGETVNFPYRDGLTPGIIFTVSKNNNGEIIYSIQIGGECPAIINGIKEESVKPYKSPQIG